MATTPLAIRPACIRPTSWSASQPVIAHLPPRLGLYRVSNPLRGLRPG